MAYYEHLCDEYDDLSKPVFDEDFTRSSMGDPDRAKPEQDDYDIEMAKAEADGLFRDFVKDTPWSSEPTSDLVSTEEVDRKVKRKLNSASSLKPKAEEDGLFGDFGDFLKDTPWSSEPTSDLVSTEVGRKMKRKLDSASSFEPTTNDQLDHTDHESKRRKLEYEVPGSSMEGQGNSVNEDLKFTIEEVLYPLLSHDDRGVAEAAANLLKICQFHSNALKLEPADREALPEAFVASDEGTASGLGREATTISCAPANNESQQSSQDRNIIDD